MYYYNNVLIGDFFFSKCFSLDTNPPVFRDHFNCEEAMVTQDKFYYTVR